MKVSQVQEQLKENLQQEKNDIRQLHQMSLENLNKSLKKRFLQELDTTMKTIQKQNKNKYSMPTLISTALLTLCIGILIGVMFQQRIQLEMNQNQVIINNQHSLNKSLTTLNKVQKQIYEYLKKVAE